MLRLPANLKSTQWQILAGPLLLLLILSMMVLPLPAFILDLLFTFNIALSIMVLLVAMFTQRTLERGARNIIEAVYASFRQVRHVKCTVSKLAPPLGGKLEKVSVVLEK